tara:strand:+ start:513 stop:1091 length:579 start_codon:yes stop_codon:yes gene_type:complete
MKITKKQLKDLIREQVTAVVNEGDDDVWLPPEELRSQAEHGPYADESYKDEMSDLLRRIMDPGEMSFDQAMDEFAGFIDKYDSQPEESETVRLSTPKHDPMDRSALGKYRRGKMTNFKEEKEDDSFSDAGEEIKKDKTTGVFTKKAKKRGMSAQEFARKVLANTDEYDLKTVRQASFAKGADTVAKKNKKKK